MKGSHAIPGLSGHARPRLVQFVRRVVNRSLRPLGLGVRPLDQLDALDEALRHHYYWYNAHKKRDIRQAKGFGQLAKEAIARRRTYLSYDRLYTLWQGIAQLRDDDPIVVEVGAYQGGSARFMADALRWHGRGNPMHVFDMFEGHAVIDPSFDGKHAVGRQFRDTSLEMVSDHLRDHANVKVVKGDFRETARALDDAGRVGLVHIDVDVYPATRFSLEYFADRMLTGGMIVVDDYAFRRTKGVWKAVKEFGRSRPDYCRLHLLTGQAVLVRLQT